MLDRADCADFGCHNSIRLETKHFLNTLALTFISFSGCFVFAMQKHYLFFASNPLVFVLYWLEGVGVQHYVIQGMTFDLLHTATFETQFSCHKAVGIAVTEHYMYFYLFVLSPLIAMVQLTNRSIAKLKSFIMYSLESITVFMLLYCLDSTLCIIFLSVIPHSYYPALVVIW